MRTDIAFVRDRLAAWGVRLRLQQSFVWVPRGLAMGLAAGLALALVARRVPLLPTPTLSLLGGLLAVSGAVVALLVVWGWPRSRLALARRFDRLFGLKERTSTALELADGLIPTESEPLRKRQLDDAAHAARRVRPADYLPLRLKGREWLVVLVLAIALAAALILPNPQDEVLAEQAALDAAIAEQVEQLETMRAGVEQDETLSPDEREAILEALDETLQTLAQRDLTQEEAVAAMETAEQRLRDVSEQAAETRAQALREASGLLGDESPAQALMEAMAEGDMESVAEAMENLSAEDAQALAGALAESAQTLSETDPALAEALAQASQALQSGDQAGAQQAMEEAASRMAEAGMTAEQMAGRLGEGGTAVAQATQQGGQGEGEGEGEGEGAGQGEGQGQGQGQSQGQGASQQPGEGDDGGGAGRGEGTGESVGGPQTGQMPTDNAAGDGGERAYEEVFAPQHLGGEGGPDVDISSGSDGEGVPIVEGELAPNPAGQSTVPYNQVYADYASAVSQALDTGYVPMGMRGVVRDYFSSLNPER